MVDKMMMTRSHTRGSPTLGEDTTGILLRGQGLRHIAKEMLLPFASMPSLDLSHNELTEVPELQMLGTTLTALDLSRNWFKEIPTEQILHLTRLECLNVSRNFLRPSTLRPALASLKQLSTLRHVDLRFNRKCDKQDLLDEARTSLGTDVTVLMSVVRDRNGKLLPMPQGTFVGASPAVRDATSLRAQLEPWPTFILRQRLVNDFGEPEKVVMTDDLPRADVMARLLKCYEREHEQLTLQAPNAPAGSSSSSSCSHVQRRAMRRIARVSGAPVRPALADAILAAMRSWASSHATANLVRTSVDAACYTILRKEASGKYEGAEKYANIWRLAERAIYEADADFAQKFTALALTAGFRGSPHIDKQNVGPFYGLSVGTFEEGTGGVCVECDSRLVACVNTRNRLGKIDGRFPHWVDVYDPTAERYSLIYYQTEGEPSPKMSAIFGPLVQDDDEEGRVARVTADAAVLRAEEQERKHQHQRWRDRRERQQQIERQLEVERRRLRQEQSDAKRQITERIRALKESGAPRERLMEAVAELSALRASHKRTRAEQLRRPAHHPHSRRRANDRPDGAIIAASGAQ